MANAMSDKHRSLALTITPLLRGAGRFAADAPEPGQAIGYFIRSPHAFASIRSIDIDAALRSPGVVGICDGREYKGPRGSICVNRRNRVEIGFIGLGAMGVLMVKRLMGAGHKVTGWNRTKEKADPLIKSGMRWADTPRAVAERSEIVFSIVTDSKAVQTVALGPQGIISGLKKGGVYIDMSTIAPTESKAVSAEFAKAGLTMLDAPISGSPVTVNQGNASVMVGGDEAAYERVRPVLLAIGPKVSYIGASGLAALMKIAVNLLLMIEVIAFGEAVALAEAGGVERSVALDAILKSVAASPVLGYRGPFILEGKMPDVPLADVSLQQKDMLLALDLARTLGSPIPLGAAANEMMNACRGLGIDRRDFVTAHSVYLTLGGQLK